MNPCILCGLTLPPGASHAGPTDCVEALKHALEQATACVECGKPVPAVFHPGCLPRAAAKRGAEFGTGVLERKVVDAISRAFLPKSEPEGPREAPRQAPRGKWEP